MKLDDETAGMIKSAIGVSTFNCTSASKEIGLSPSALASALTPKTESRRSIPDKKLTALYNLLSNEVLKIDRTSAAIVRETLARLLGVSSVPGNRSSPGEIIFPSDPLFIQRHCDVFKLLKFLDCSLTSLERGSRYIVYGPMTGLSTILQEVRSRLKSSQTLHIVEIYTYLTQLMSEKTPKNHECSLKAIAVELNTMSKVQITEFSDEGFGSVCLAMESIECGQKYPHIIISGWEAFLLGSDEPSKEIAQFLNSLEQISRRYPKVGLLVAVDAGLLVNSSLNRHLFGSRVVHISGVEKEDLDNLLTSSLDPEQPKIIERLLYASSGHPFLIHLVMSHMVNWSVEDLDYAVVHVQDMLFGNLGTHSERLKVSRFINKLRRSLEIANVVNDKVPNLTPLSFSMNFLEIGGLNRLWTEALLCMSLLPDSEGEEDIQLGTVALKVAMKEN